jgi:hypothetical protein
MNSCLALLVVCAAPDRESLQALKRAAVSAEWELTPGATTMEEALAQVGERGAHVLVVWGIEGLADEARRRFPGVRIVVLDGAGAADDSLTVPIGSLEDVRAAVPWGPSR